MDINTVRAWLGHVSLNTTNIYAEIDLEMKTKALAKCEITKALKKEREKLHEMTSHRQCFKPIPQLIEELNRHLEGWKNYFDFGYPRVAFGEQGHRRRRIE